MNRASIANEVSTVLRDPITKERQRQVETEMKIDREMNKDYRDPENRESHAKSKPGESPKIAASAIGLRFKVLFIAAVRG